MIACTVKQMSKEVSPNLSADDIAKIRNFSSSRSRVRRWSLCSPSLRTICHLTLLRKNLRFFSLFSESVWSAGSLSGSQHPRPRLHKEGYSLHAAGWCGEGVGKWITHQRGHQHPAHRYHSFSLNIPNQDVHLDFFWLMAKILIMIKIIDH